MFDILIKKGKVVDGTGRKGYIADIGVKNGIIADISEKIDALAINTIYADGHIVSPGFIDIHSHSDLCPFIDGLKSQSKLFQGITLEIFGNCGISCLPVDNESRERLTNFFGTALQLPLNGAMLEDDSITDYVKHIARQPASTNVGVLIGHGTLRGCVIGLGMERATQEQLCQMENILDRELDRGAFGMSLGLIYPPSSYGDINEFIALAKVLKKHEAILSVHMRSESTKIFESVDEMIEVAEKTNVHLEISHLKLIGKPQWGKSLELLDKIKKARARGINVTCDQYPYIATSTGLSALVPKWACDGGPIKMCERLQKPTEKLLQEMEEELERRGGASNVLIVATHESHREFEGKRLAAIADVLNVKPVVAAAKLLVDAGGGVSCCYFCLSENDMLNIMKEKFVVVGTDGYALTYDKNFLGTNPHPRSFGTFPRFFETVREHKLMSLEDAVAKTTSTTADILGIKDRGRLIIGNKADITIFDYEHIADNSTYIESLKKPSGIKAVIIDGKIALEDDEQLNGNFGKVILHKN